ncbi:MAG: epoxyqueuosine reductase QueH [Coriobacteriia bacterium]|nr:epoxyqueuosine reductase QueH [Coriobacteriia bacterium]
MGERMRKGGTVRIALHACCGPCLLEPLAALLSEHEVLVVYANPNIHPLREYERRRDTLTSYAEDRGLEVVEAAYDPSAWVEAVAGAAGDPGRRCERCFRLRLGMAAREAARTGAEAVATTLTVSPHQDPEAIARAGEEACAEHGVRFLATDFRSRYPEAVRRSRELGMYRQRYCGCILSEAEAAAASRSRGAR